MKNYIVYNQDGKILRTGTCPDNLVYAQAQDGESVIEGVVKNNINYKVVDGKVKYVKVKANKSVLIDNLRAERDSMLSASDWTQMPDSPLSEIDKLRYKKYRQALRDLPQNYGTINELSDVTFPNIEDF